MLQYFIIWLILATAILVIWHLIQDERAKAREERYERAIKAAEILKRQPVQYSNLTLEELIESLEHNHERQG